MIDFSNFKSLTSVIRYFNTEDVCKQALIDARWSDGDIVCPHCGQHHCARRADGRFFRTEEPGTFPERDRGTGSLRHGLCPPGL